MQQVTLVPMERQPWVDDDENVYETVWYGAEGSYWYQEAVRPGKTQSFEIEPPDGTLGFSQLASGLWVWIVGPEVPKLCGICKGQCEYN